jgi:hypothetical protein
LWSFSVLTSRYASRTTLHLAGGAERYSTGLVGMKAFVAPFHHMKHMCGRPKSGRLGKAEADSSARFCIEMWRAEAVLLWHDRSLVAVPLPSMTKSTVLKPFEFDTVRCGPRGSRRRGIRPSRNDVGIHGIPIAVESGLRQRVPESTQVHRLVDCISPAAQSV